MKINLTRDQLIKLKTGSFFTLIIALIVAALSSLSFIWADHELVKLDSGKLDERLAE